MDRQMLIELIAVGEGEDIGLGPRRLSDISSLLPGSRLQRGSLLNRVGRHQRPIASPWSSWMSDSEGEDRGEEQGDQARFRNFRMP
jgi:hypothetical protein